MSDYKELLGLDIEAKSADPTDVITGEVWFNTSTSQIKYKKPDGANTRTTSGNLIVGRRLAGQGTIGIQTSALCISGLDGYASKTENESYNGSSWTELGDVNASRFLASAFGADATAAIFCGGFGPSTGTTANESWNGSSWTEVNDLNTGRNYSVGAGIQTAGLVFGSSSGNAVESWDGTNDILQEIKGKATYKLLDSLNVDIPEYLEKNVKTERAVLPESYEYFIKGK